MQTPIKSVIGEAVKKFCKTGSFLDKILIFAERSVHKYLLGSAYTAKRKTL